MIEVLLTNWMNKFCVYFLITNKTKRNLLLLIKKQFVKTNIVSKCQMKKNLKVVYKQKHRFYFSFCLEHRLSSTELIRLIKMHSNNMVSLIKINKGTVHH